MIPETTVGANSCHSVLCHCSSDDWLSLSYEFYSPCYNVSCRYFHNPLEVRSRKKDIQRQGWRYRTPAATLMLCKIGQKDVQFPNDSYTLEWPLGLEKDFNMLSGGDLLTAAQIMVCVPTVDVYIQPPPVLVQSGGQWIRWSPCYLPVCNYLNQLQDPTYGSTESTNYSNLTESA